MPNQTEKRAEIEALKWALDEAKSVVQFGFTAERSEPAKRHAVTLSHMLFQLVNPPNPNLIMIDPEAAHRWLTGQDKSLEAELRALAQVYEEQLQDPRPTCRLCQGDGRLDDIFCWRCDGTGKEPEGSPDDDA